MCACGRIDNGILEALRGVTLSHEFSRALLETVVAQTKTPFDPWRHAEVVDEVLEGFATGVNMMKDLFWTRTRGIWKN